LEKSRIQMSPRSARRPNHMDFSGQKRIGDFERRKENFLIIEFIGFRP